MFRFLHLTPGIRSGVIHDERYAALCPLEQHLSGLIEAQHRAEEEQASQQSLGAIQRAFRETLLAVPPEEFDIQACARGDGSSRRAGTTDGERLKEAANRPISAPRNPPCAPALGGSS